VDFICKQVVIGQQAVLQPKRAVPVVGLELYGANVYKYITSMQYYRIGVAIIGEGCTGEPRMQGTP